MSDTIRRSPKNKENPFAQVSRGMLQDKTLSYEARGMLSYLLSKSGDWEVRVYDLQIPGCGRDKVYRVLDELRKRGYIGGHAKYQDEKGQWHWTPYDVYEDPSFNTEKPFPEKPYTDEPNTENTEIKQTKTTKKRLEDKDIEQQKRKEKDIALASDDAARKSRFENPDGSSKWPESDDPSTLRLEGNEQKSTQDEKAKGKGRKTTTPPSSPVPPAPSSPKRVSRLEWATDHTFKSGGMTGHLIAQMQGKATKGVRKEFNFESPVTFEEVYYFKNWYERRFPQSGIPTSAETLYERFAQMRGHEGYERSLETAKPYIEEAYLRETCPPEEQVQRTPWGSRVLTDEERASPEEIAELQALLRTRKSKESAS